jgi:DNA primase
MAEKPAGWVDYVAVKKVPFDWVLKRLDLFDAFTPSGEELKGKCPIPAHTGEKKKETFFVNVGKGMFTCHQCKKRGNVLDFVMAQRDVPVKEAGEWLAEFFAEEKEREKEGIAESVQGVREEQLPFLLFDVCVKVLERVRDPSFDVEACARRFSEWATDVLEGK